MTSLKQVKAQQFFQRANSAILLRLQHQKQLFQACFSQQPFPPFQSKLIIYHQQIIVSQNQGHKMQAILFLELNEAIRFKLSKDFTINKQITPELSSEVTCLELIKGCQKILKIYFQSSQKLNQCIVHLSSKIFRRDFENQFRKIRSIGKGTTSKFLQVRRKSDNQKFAAKKFKKSFLFSRAKRVQSFINEISLLRSMNHPNILKIHCVYETNVDFYIVTDPLKGGTLKRRIRTLESLKIGEIEMIMAGIAKGLEYMHSLGVIHRNIKLENIAFRSFNSFEPVIVDFGLATNIHQEPYLCNQYCTPRYMPPQIIGIENNKKITAGSDIFSAGVILHYLFTNKFLFQGKGNNQVYPNSQNKSLDLNSQPYSLYNKKAVHLMSKMLSLKEEDRITAEGVLLHPFLSNEISKIKSYLV